ncbi:MAG: hypothetical protein WAZ48_04770 [Lysobacteraceae bacterium]
MNRADRNEGMEANPTTTADTHEKPTPMKKAPARAGAFRYHEMQ